MNILILTTHLNPGGISRYVVTLAQELSSRNRVWVASSGGAWALQLAETGVGLEHIPINTKSVLSPKIMRSVSILADFIRNNGIQIIHANTRVTQCVAHLLYKRCGVKYVSTFHGFYKPHFFRKLFAFRGARTIAVSQAVKQYLCRVFRFPAVEVSVIYNGINKQDFAAKKHTKRDFGFSDADILIGILGRLSREKGHLLALEAFSHLSHRDNVRLLITGEGRYKSKLLRFVRVHSLTSQVSFLFLKSNEFLDIVDILLVPSSSEGFGYVVLEGLAKGVCVVGFATGGIKEIIRDNIDGILFHAYKPEVLSAVLDRLITDSVAREKIREQAARRVEAFSLSHMAHQTEALYREVVSS